MVEKEGQREIARLMELLERPVKANLANRAIARWVLEFVRNCMVVATLLFLARKSGSWLLWTITIVTGFALMSYCYTYVENAWFQFSNEKIPSRGWWMHFGIIVGTLVTQLILMGITATFYVTLDKIVSVQFQAPRSP
jgi:hypothetical protein